MRVLVVEDHRELREAIVRRLRACGHAVDEASDGSRADNLRSGFEYDAVVLDRILPDGDSIVRLRDWRRSGDITPVLMLTALDRIEDRVEGLEAGADDYLVKPFSMSELQARVSAISRRRSLPRPNLIRVAGVEFDLGRRELRRQGVLIPLRPKEYAVLELLAGRMGRIVTRESILDSCWDLSSEPSSNVEEVVIASLRRKLGDPPLIHTVRGSGYVFKEPDDDH